MDTFELWSYDVSGDLGQYAEHTYIKCPDKGTYFDCWGNHQSLTEGAGIRRFSCQGIYEVADCCRRNIFDVKDTAGIGVYGVNGVCHQTANLFLYSSGRAISIDDGVKGYWLSSLVYGTYGDLNPCDLPLKSLFVEAWKLNVYNPCYEKYKGNEVVGNELFQIIAQLHKTILEGAIKISHAELIHQEAAIVAKQALPDLDTALFKDIHIDFLRDKLAVITSALKGDDLCNKINEVALQFQISLAKRIGAEAYEKLTGLKAGETLNIIDPAIAAKATS
jgi:hypothetical protein